MLGDALTGATIALAVATFLVVVVAVWSGWLARSAITRQLEADRRPLVFPWLESTWAERVKEGRIGEIREIPVKNGGRGPALNVGGAIYWKDSAGGGASFAPTALGVGEETTVATGTPGPNFNVARGYLRYTDAAGVEWQTHFVFSGTVGLVVPPQLRLEIIGAARTSDLGEPQYNSDAWVNDPGVSWRWGSKPKTHAKAPWIRRGAGTL